MRQAVIVCPIEWCRFPTVCAAVSSPITRRLRRVESFVLCTRVRASSAVWRTVPREPITRAGLQRTVRWGALGCLPRGAVGAARESASTFWLWYALSGPESTLHEPTGRPWGEVSSLVRAFTRRRSERCLRMCPADAGVTAWISASLELPVLAQSSSGGDCRRRIGTPDVCAATSIQA